MMDVMSVPYTDTGTKMTISLFIMGEKGVMVCTQDDHRNVLGSDGKPTVDRRSFVDRAFCPCCFSYDTRERVMGMIRKSGVKVVTVADSYWEKPVNLVDDGTFAPGSTLYSFDKDWSGLEYVEAYIYRVR